MARTRQIGKKVTAQTWLVNAVCLASSLTLWWLFAGFWVFVVVLLVVLVALFILVRIFDKNCHLQRHGSKEGS